jgi:hypothetical protein
MHCLWGHEAQVQKSPAFRYRKKKPRRAKRHFLKRHQISLHRSIWPGSSSAGNTTLPAQRSAHGRAARVPFRKRSSALESVCTSHACVRPPRSHGGRSVTNSDREVRVCDRTRCTRGKE